MGLFIGAGVLPIVQLGEYFLDEILTCCGFKRDNEFEETPGCCGCVKKSRIGTSPIEKIRMDTMEDVSVSWFCRKCLYRYALYISFKLHPQCNRQLRHGSWRLILMVFTFTNIQSWIIDADDMKQLPCTKLSMEKKTGWFDEKEMHLLVYIHCFCLKWCNRNLWCNHAVR